MPKKKESIPRFVMTLSDTQSTVQISAGSNDIEDFTRPFDQEKQIEMMAKNESSLMFKFFKEAVEQIDGQG